MRYVRDEVPASRLDLLEGLGHPVEVRGQLPELVGRGHRDAFAISPGGDARACPRHRVDRRHDAPGDEEADRERGEDSGDRRDSECGGHGPQHAVKEGRPELGMLAQEAGHEREVLGEGRRREGLGCGPQHDRADQDHEQVRREELSAEAAPERLELRHAGSSTNL